MSTCTVKGTLYWTIIGIQSTVEWDQLIEIVKKRPNCKVIKPQKLISIIKYKALELITMINRIAHMLKKGTKMC